MTGFAKRGLIHVSNFATLRMCNSAHVRPTTLKFGTWPFLSLWLYERKFQRNSSLKNEVMPLQSCKIGCVYKTPFRKSGHIFIYIVCIRMCTRDATIWVIAILRIAFECIAIYCRIAIYG